jgi:hypothetical protein
MKEAKRPGALSELMRLTVRSSFAALAMCLIFLAKSAHAQSLSISKRADSSFWIQASAPAANPGTLQISENLHLWVDLHDGVQEPYSAAVDTNGVTERYFRLTPTPPPAPQIVVMLVGDSMSSDCCGWGSGFGRYFKPNATFVNYSQAWMSSSVFLQSAEFDKMLKVKPDYLLMQFVYSETGIPEDQYVNNLRTIINVVRGWGGTPIMITLQAQRKWDAQGNLIPSLHPYNALVKQLGVEVSTPVMDIFPSTKKLFTELGEAGCEFMKWPVQPEDGMHDSPLGAIWIARLMTHLLPDSFGPYLTGIFEPPPNP